MTSEEQVEHLRQQQCEEVKQSACADKNCTSCSDTWWKRALGEICSQINSFVWNNTKYLFYLLVLFLYPSQMYRYFFIHGEYPGFGSKDELTMLMKMAIPGFFVVMAFWSHWIASPPTDPGYTNWEDFRTPQQLEDVEDRQKWQDPKYVRGKQLQAREDAESANLDSMQCQKCGSMKVEGVHHCSQCNRCVYMMDHHCPWTNNCVGYYTMKPFLLFLMYVSLLCYYSVFQMYRSARFYKMRHISLLNLIPNSQLRWILQMYMADEQERKYLKAENDRLYQKEMEAQKGRDPDEIFSLQAFLDAFKSWECSKSSIFYSKGNFWDFFTIVLCLICGLYTTGLFVQTLYYVYHQSSLINSHKIQRLRRIRSNAPHIRRQRQELLKYKKPLSYNEMCEKVLSEPRLSLFSFLPLHNKRRQISIESRKFVNKSD